MKKENKNKLNKKETKDILDKLQYGISIQKIIHKGWKEYEKAMANITQTGFKLTRRFGKYQYIMTSDKGEISIIKIKNFKNWNWEIFAFKNNNLFSDTQSFSTKKKAFFVARKYLTE